MTREGRRLLFVLASVVLLAPIASAQSIEVTPFIGYQFGGEFEHRNNFFGEDFFREDFELDEGESFGLIADIPISRHFQVELLYSNQETQLELVDPFVGIVFDQDVDVQYYQAGLLWQFRTDSFRPFIAGGIGATDFDFGNGAGETRFSSSFGGGVKAMANDHVGFRFEGRAYATFVDNDEDAFCGSDYCYGYRDDALMVQWDLKFGITFAF